jgi:hypothetical protein
MKYNLDFFRQILLAGLTFAPAIVVAQNMNSPYSVYGIGDIQNRSFDRTSGIGGGGFALQYNSYITSGNPASLSGLERSIVVAGIIFSGISSKFKGNAIDASNSRSKDFGVKGLAVGIRLNNFWSSSIGFSQFSNVSYKFTGSRAVEGSTENYNTNYEGDGGLNDYAWTNSINFGKHFSFGIKSSILAGAINQEESLYEPGLQTEISTKQQDYFSNLRFRYGLNYNTSLSKKWDFALGAAYSGKTKLETERSLTVMQNEAIIVDEKILGYDRFWLPATYLVGINVTRNKKTSFVFDYAYEDWSSLKIGGNGWNLINSHQFSGGVEFSKKVNYLNRMIERKYYQVGGFINNSYLQVGFTPIREYGITAGMGGWLGKNLLYAISTEVGVRGTTSQNLIRENYFKVNFTLSYKDFIQSKGRKYD